MPFDPRRNISRGPTTNAYDTDLSLVPLPAILRGPTNHTTQYSGGPQNQLQLANTSPLPSQILELADRRGSAPSFKRAGKHSGWAYIFSPEWRAEDWRLAAIGSNWQQLEAARGNRSQLETTGGNWLRFAWTTSDL